MNRKPRTTQAGMSVGFISLLIIFVVLCLITFAILALTTSNADMALTNRNYTYVSRYYVASNECHTKIGFIDQTLEAARQDTSTDEEFYAAVDAAFPEGGDIFIYDRDSRVITFYGNLSEISQMRVEVQVNDPENESRYTILTWNAEPLPQEMEEQEQTLWDGGFTV